MTQPCSWRTLLLALRDELPSEDYRTWVRPLKPIVEDRHRILLEAPNDRFAGIVRETIGRSSNSSQQGYSVPK